jgi:hypothetical protein
MSALETINGGVILGVIFAVIGATPLLFGLITGAMPSPSLWDWGKGPSYRDEVPSMFWLGAALWGAFTAFGCYQIYMSW